MTDSDILFSNSGQFGCQRAAKFKGVLRAKNELAETLLAV